MKRKDSANEAQIRVRLKESDELATGMRREQGKREVEGVEIK